MKALPFMVAAGASGFGLYLIFSCYQETVLAHGEVYKGSRFVLAWAVFTAGCWWLGELISG